MEGYFGGKEHGQHTPHDHGMYTWRLPVAVSQRERADAVAGFASGRMGGGYSRL